MLNDLFLRLFINDPTENPLIVPHDLLQFLLIFLGFNHLVKVFFYVKLIPSICQVVLSWSRNYSVIIRRIVKLLLSSGVVKFWRGVLNGKTRHLSTETLRTLRKGKRIIRTIVCIKICAFKLVLGLIQW